MKGKVINFAIYMSLVAIGLVLIYVGLYLVGWMADNLANPISGVLIIAMMTSAVLFMIHQSV